MPKLTIHPGLTLNYQVEGEGSTHILLCNGAGLPLTFWGDFATKLAAQASVIRFDQRNAGLTEFSGQFTLGDITSDISHLLDHLEVERVIIMGHAWGGRVAQVFARDFPHRTQGLVICGTGGQFPAIDMKATLRDLAHAHQARDKQMWQQHLETAFCAPGFAQRSPEQFNQLANAIWQSASHQNAKWDPKPYPSNSYWGTAEAPSLLIYGNEDKNGTRQNARDLEARLMNARLVMLQDAGHFVVRERENEVLTEVTGFVETLNKQMTP